VSEVVRASCQLTALAVAVRPDWDERDVSGVILQATNAGMTWPQILTGLPRLMADPKACPRDLIPDGWSPLARVAHPGASERGAALARQLLTGGGS